MSVCVLSISLSRRSDIMFGKKVEAPVVS